MSERGASLRGAHDTDAGVKLRGASARNGAAVYIGVPAASVAPRVHEAATHSSAPTSRATRRRCPARCERACEVSCQRGDARRWRSPSAVFAAVRTEEFRPSDVEHPTRGDHAMRPRDRWHVVARRRVRASATDDDGAVHPHRHTAHVRGGAVAGLGRQTELSLRGRRAIADRGNRCTRVRVDGC